MNASLPLIAAQPMDEVVAETFAARRFTTRLLTIFAMVALFLGASGIYGVLAYSIAQRTREIGIRKALGARPGQVVQMVVRQGMVPVFAGLAVGAASSVLVGRAIAGLLHGVSPLDPATYLGVTVLLGVVAVTACFAPAVRAVRLDPLTALRSD
jgi:ABC-type antimicrobial peptide transport system permease subunit